MYNDNDPNGFGESRNETGPTQESWHEERRAETGPAQENRSGERQEESGWTRENPNGDGAEAQRGSETERTGGGHQRRNYYDERYRGGQGGYQGQGAENAGYRNPDGGYGYQQDGGGFRSGSGSGQGGYGYHGGNGQNGEKPRKKSRARIAAAVLLVVVFVGFCGGISWLAVSSLQEQFTSASAEESGKEEAPEEYAGQQPEQPADAGGGQIASAGTIQESGNVTAVVTDVTDVVERVMPACVSITNNYTEQVQDFWGQSYSRDEVASGSGIIIGENATELLVVSNNHVVADANTLQVQFIDGAVVEAQVKGVDSAVDLAVIAVKLEDIDEETKSAICIAQMGDSDNLKIGEPAIAIGNALGYGQSVTTGVISALNRTLEVSEDGTSNALIQTDAAINPGNSGGALLNINGEVVGINSSKIGASVVEGMGYAIPISTAKPIIEELMTHETRLQVADEDKGYLGISCINVTSEITESFSMPEGIFVAQVYEGTGADRAGLVRGDIITAVNGVTVKNQTELTKQLSYYKAGETVEITIMQGSPTGFQAKNVEVTLSTYDELNESSQNAQEEAQEQSGSRTWRLP